MDVRTYRARSMQEALRLIRQDLGPDAAVLHTREVSAGMLGSMFGGRQIEVTASNEVHVPSRLPPLAEKRTVKETLIASGSVASQEEVDVGEVFRHRVRENLARQAIQPTSLADNGEAAESAKPNQAAAFFPMFTDLIDAGVSDKIARELLDTVKRRLAPNDRHDSLLLKANLVRLVEEGLRVRGPIRLVPGRCTTVALVGPTGVGKTTTIAKIAANFRLKEKCRVGLITVDTYRIAAVEQLRTYAEIIDLPMEVIGTPREMRGAVERFSELDLVLIDTAGRSPRDETQIQELRAMLAESRADEVHLVLSSVTATDSLLRSAERFSAAGATHLVLTKTDEAGGLGSLLPLLRSCELPLTYLTHGQNVPHDIRSAERRSLARSLLGLEV